VDTKVQLGEEQIKVTVDGYRRILAIGKEVPPTQAFGESIGIEKFSPETLEPLFSVIERKILVENSVNEFYESAFQEVIDRGTPIYAVDTGMFKAIEIDTFEDIRTAETAVFPYLSPTPSTRIRKK
jgi:choline kinase